VSELLPEFAAHTLPEASTAIPEGTGKPEPEIEPGILKARCRSLFNSVGRIQLEFFQEAETRWRGNLPAAPERVTASIPVTPK